MAENDFLSGLLGGVKDVGSSIYGGISGLLGGGEQTPAAGGQMQDSMSMLSPADQKRLMFSTLGQVGAALLAAGARQSPESRAQALAQLGKIGPGIEESIQRTAALQQQRALAQRQAELFAPQLMAAKAGAAEKELALKMQQETLSAQDAIKKLRDENPEALAKDLGLSAGYVKAMPIADLVEATKQIAIKRATKSPLESLYEAEVAKALNLGMTQPPVAAAQPQMPVAAPPAQVAPVMPAITAPSVGLPAPADNMALDYSKYPETGRPPVVTEPALAAPQQIPTTVAPAQAGGVVSMPTPTNPEAARLRAIAGNPAIYLTKPDEAKKLADLADKIDPPGALEAAKKLEVAKAEMRLNQPKIEQALAGTMMKSENVSNTISRAIDRVNNWSAGYGSLLSYIPESQARNLQADIATIKANIGFDELQRMRDASPTGGALGQVAVQELNYLQSAVANLDQAQSPGDLKRALADIKTSMKGYQTLREKAYEKDYGQKFDLKKFTGQPSGEGEKPSAAAEAQGTPKRVTKEEYDSLPSGALFTDPNGQVRRKP